MVQLGAKEQLAVASTEEKTEIVRLKWSESRLCVPRASSRVMVVKMMSVVVLSSTPGLREARGFTITASRPVSGVRISVDPPFTSRAVTAMAMA
jgi:hypothetical protein